VNILLWALQVLLALHTAMGALWKFSHSEQSVPSLAAIPHAVWLTLSVVELLCSIALLAPALSKPLAFLVPIAAACIGAEMLFYTGLHLYSGSREYGPMIYWLVVAAFCAFLTYGRLVLKPL